MEHTPTIPPATPRADVPADKRPRAQRRAREVSSRYMSLLASPTSSAAAPSGAHPLPPPHPRRNQAKQSLHFQQPQHHLQQLQTTRSPSPAMERRRPSIPSSPDHSDSESEGSFVDENRPDPSARLSRSMDTPVTTAGMQSKPLGTQSMRAMSRLFRENGEERHHPPPMPQQPRGDDGRIPPGKVRAGTPMVQYQERAASAASPRETFGNAISASRRNSTQVARSHREPLLAGNAAAGHTTPARFSTSPPDEVVNGNGSVDTSLESSSLAECSESDTCSIGSHGGWCDSPPIRARGSRVRANSECRSSMPEADRLPTMPGRDTDGSGLYRTPSLINRSLNSALSSCQPSAFNSQRPVASKWSQTPKPHSNLPSLPGAQKTGMDARKARKAASSRQDEIHVLRMLDNQYLQWRFANAKAQIAERSRRVVAERSLSGLTIKLSELHDCVTIKRIELARLEIIKKISTVLHSHMPHLEEWNILETEYSDSLSGVIKALQDASLRLPIIGNVKADATELGEALESATNVMDTLSLRVGTFVPQAAGVECAVTDLAKVVSTELVLIEKCGELLAEVQRLQVVECCLRSQVIQLKQPTSLQTRIE